MSHVGIASLFAIQLPSSPKQPKSTTYTRRLYRSLLSHLTKIQHTSYHLRFMLLECQVIPWVLQSKHNKARQNCLHTARL